MELGNVSADFPPDKEKENPRNSEGAFLKRKDKTIAFAYSKYRGKSYADWAPADICMAVSEDGGRTFYGDQKVVDYEEENVVNVMCASLMRMKNGDLGLFYLARCTYTKTLMFLRRSKDEGKTWGERVNCTPQEGFFVVNNDRVVRLSSGRILIPAACHRTGDFGFDSWSEAMFFYSDDDGITWKAAEGKCSMPYLTHCSSGLQEPGVLELYPGVLWGFARTDLGRQYEMYSMDNGNTWTGAQPSRFTAPNSPLSMKRDQKTKDIYAVWNPVPEYNGRKKTTEIFTGGRTPLVLAVSHDNGKTFGEEIPFETEEDHGYCYCAMYFTESALLLGYCAGGPEDGNCLSSLRIRRIPRKELSRL